MKQGTDRRASPFWAHLYDLMRRELAKGRHLPPKGSPAFRALWRRVPWKMLLLCLGFVVQAGLLWLMWQLIDLVIQLFEVWTLLARHSLGL